MEEIEIVTDSFLYQNGYTKPITDKLDELGITYTVFSNVQLDPALANAQEGAKAMTAFQLDTIIALGGGSAMDAGKIMWVMYEPSTTSAPARTQLPPHERNQGDVSESLLRQVSGYCARLPAAVAGGFCLRHNDNILMININILLTVVN